MMRIPFPLWRLPALSWRTPCNPSRSFANAKRRPTFDGKPGKPQSFQGKRTTKRMQTAAPKRLPHQPSKTRKEPKHRNDVIVPSKRFIPPALLLPTASPFAYVSRAAFDGEEDPRSLAKSLFADVVDADSNPKEQQPFHGMSFVYFSPQSFRHELPEAKAGERPIPEVAFLGRSNVGKSSLINALMGKDLARCSKHPGRTQQPYYYGLVSGESSTADPSAAAGFLVDLPGYGFASAPNQNVEDWQENTQKFLLDRRNAGSLRRLFLLIDARRGLGESKTTTLDLSVMRWMDEEDIPYTIAVTKADCVSAPQLVKVANEACMRYQQQRQEEMEQVEHDGVDPEDVEPAGWMGPVVHVTSARKNEGLQELRSAVEAEFYASRS